MRSGSGRDNHSAVTKPLGVLLVVAAAITAVVGIGWLLLDAIGTEWDYCPGGSDCIAGSTMGAGFTLAAVVIGLVGFGLLRGKRNSAR
jgi:hypothetical protein